MSGWRLWPLDALASVAVSTVDKKSYDDETPALLCNYTDVYYNNLITSSIEFMRATATKEQFERFAVRAGDVVITKDSETSDDIARPAYVPHDLPGVVYGYHLAVYRPFDWRYGKFLRYAFDSTVMRAELARRTSGVTRVGLSQDTLRNLRISAPGPEGAQQIADYLDYETAEIDAFIADLDELSQLEVDRVRADQEHLIVHSAPDLAIRRLMPVRVTGVSVNASQEPAEPGQLGVLKTSAVSRGFFRPEENKSVLEPDEIQRLTTPVEADRVLVNRANTPSMVGSAAYAGTAYNRLFLSDKIWSLDFAAVNEYVWRALQTRYYRDQVELLAVGASTSMQNLGYEDFLSVRLPIPKTSEQRRIADHLRSVWVSLEASLADTDAAIALAKERRAALITAAVTGQIDVTARHKPVVDSIQTAIEEAR